MYSFARVDQGIVRALHEGEISVDDTRQFRAFLKQYRGKLLVDMRGTPPGDARRELLRVRAMLPQTACIGTSQQRMICDELPGKEVYLSEMRHFASEAEALAWLHGERVQAENGEEAAAA